MAYNKKYAEYYDKFNAGKNYEKEVDFIENVLRKFGVHGKKILDLGCGTGLHEKEFFDRGYEVSGLDLSPEMIEIAKKRNPSCKFFVGDMSGFELNEKFDAVITMFSAMGYLTENSQIKNFFESAKKHLKEDGLLVLDVWNGLGVMNELPTSREKSADIGNLKITRRSFPDLDSKNHVNNVRFNVNVFENGNLVDDYDENHQVRFFFPQELKKYGEDAGFELLHLCPSYEIDSNLTEKHWNMVLVARLK